MDIAGDNKGSITVIGIGPGAESMMTLQALHALDQADVIVGYNVYLDLLGERYREKEMLSTPMKQEAERCRMCFEEAAKGKSVAMVCSGDAGIYGMASLMFEIGEEYAGSGEINILPGITAASSGAAVLGAPLNHDFCVISLSDLLTPWERIEKRLKAAADGDFCIALYNPSSHKRADYLKKACEILMGKISPDTACGYVKNIGREGTVSKVCTLAELADEQVDMFTTVFIGNSMTRVVNGRLITPRGYKEKSE
jgi:precorrin-3B C17-methyltransferase